MFNFKKKAFDPFDVIVLKIKKKIRQFYMSTNEYFLQL